MENCVIVLLVNLVLIKDYRETTKSIIEVINKAVAEYSIEVTDYKNNIIESMGK